MNKPPVFVMSFNRPDYLSMFLESLKNQGQGLEDREIHLFQDNAVNRFSGKRRASDDVIRACIRAFLQHFPGGKCHIAPYNLGVCLNYERAEQYAFSRREFDVVYFFEDDLVLGPHYLGVMDAMAVEVKNRTHIAYFAAYGDHLNDVDVQEDKKRSLISMHNNWGFGLTNNHWQEMRKFISPYIDMLMECDYAERPHSKIFEWYKSLGFGPEYSSQDAAKWTATTYLHRQRVSSLTCNAKYIGKTGLHMNPSMYDHIGYDKTQIFPYLFTEFEYPDAEGAIQESAKEYEEARRIARDVIPGLIDRYNSNRRERIFMGAAVSRQDVTYLYRCILGRDPESEEVITKCINARMSFGALRKKMMESEEFKMKQIK